MIQIIGAGGSPPKQRPPREPQTSRDSLDSRAYVKIIELLAEGEIEGLKDGAQSVYLNNTPLQNSDGSYNFENFEFDYRNGTQTQTYIPGFNEVLSEFPVNTLVTKSAAISKTITRTSVNAVRVTISIPQLQRIDDTGDLRGAKIQFTIDVKLNGGNFETRIDDTITGRTNDLYQRDYRVTLGDLQPSQYPVIIRVTRVTDDSNDPKLVNAFSWYSYTEITYAKLAYPNSALVSMRIDAEQFNSIPQRSYLIRGLKIKIPSNATVDPTTGALIYSGTWNGNFGAAVWCSDPAWCLWDLLTSTRYGFGNYLNANLLDKWAFYTASVYCSALNTRPSGTTNDYHATTGRHGVPDGLGNYEPRFSCNVNIQTAEDAYKLINDMCSVFRVMPYWSTGALTISQDSPATPVYLFTQSNVTEEGFSYSGSAQKTRTTVAIVKYFDNILRDYSYEVVEDQKNIAKYGVLTKEIEAFACTSRGQAHRLGEWLLYAEQYETEVVAFTASIEAGVVVRPGQVISIHDTVRSPSYRWAGRINAATTTAITVDSPDTLSLGTSPKLTVILPDGTLQSRTVSSISGSVITVSTAFTTAPNIGSIWMFENAAVAPTTNWRVLTVSEQDGTRYAITALTYNSTKYSYIERGEELQLRSLTDLTTIPSPPESVSVSEALYLYQNEVRSKVTAQWAAVKAASQYEVQWRKDDGNWTTERVRSPLFEILNITPGQFDFRVFSVNATDIASSTGTTASFTAVGKVLPPADVTGFSAVVDPVIGVTLQWNSVADLDLQGYEIWQGAAWGTGTKLGSIQGTSLKVSVLPNTTVKFWIKALDTSGSYSLNAVAVTVNLNTAAAPAVSGAFSGRDLELRWTDVSGTLATQSYEIRYGAPSDTWATATSLGNVQGNTFRVRANWSGTRRFFVAAEDINGSAGTAGTFDAVVILPIAPSITQQVVDNNVLLRWTAVTRTLPIEVYEVRKGTTWASASIIGTKQGLFTTVFETEAGTYTYWIAGVDSAGNYGTPSSVSAVVSQPPDYQLRMAADSAFSGTKTNTYTENGALVAAVSTTETWAAHFTTARPGYPSGWQTIQNQYNAGFQYYAMPAATAGAYEEVMDYQSTLAASKITVTATSQTIAGSLSVTPTISVSNTSAFGPWSDNVGVTSIYATNFRWIKVRYDFAAAGGDDLLVISALNVRLDTKLRNDFGNGTALVPLVSTYTQSGTTITITTPVAHTLTVGTKIDVKFTSGTAASGVYTVATVPTGTTLTVTSTTSATTSGNVTVHFGGTVVTFNVGFVDVEAISVTPASTSAVLAVYDFQDVPNPASFKVLLFDTSGLRVGGGFSWSARGV